MLLERGGIGKLYSPTSANPAQQPGIINPETGTTQKPSVRFREGVLQNQSYTRQGSVFAPKPDHLPSDDQIRNK